MSINMGHPKGLYLLFFTEMWERFSYYGMRALFVLYMIQALMYDKELSSQIYGNYTGLVYLTPLVGGYLADRCWGNRRSILWGALIMALGQFILFISANFYDTPSIASPLMLAGLGVLAVGNGLFKPNISSMVGDLYAEGDSRKDAAYTIFYMGINLGAMIAVLWCGFVGNTGDPADFRWGYLSACVGMLLGLGIFYFFKNKYLVTPSGEPIGMPPARVRSETTQSRDWRRIGLYLGLFTALWSLFVFVCGLDVVGSVIYASAIVVPLFIILDRSLSRVERQRIGVIYIIAFFVIFFWAAFEQAGASLTYFADEQTDRVLWGWEMPASYFQSFNALFIILLAPLFAVMWAALGRRGVEPSSPVKQALGLFLLSMGYLIIALGVRGVDGDMKVSMLWLVGLYFIHTMGELCLSPIGLSMVNKLSPARFASLLMGVWMLSLAAANKFSGVLSGYYPEGGVAKHFMGYEIATLSDFFMLFVFMSGAAAVILFLLSSYLKRLMQGVE